mmetsp:Transcript_8497/g.13498  ORF Transcript_8497/g.13498 Transcript_8497/m.13498 type:complete len:256 (-) Transcript_8497:149-916(-)
MLLFAFGRDRIHRSNFREGLREKRGHGAKFAMFALCIDEDVSRVLGFLQRTPHHSIIFIRSEHLEDLMYNNNVQTQRLLRPPHIHSRELGKNSNTMAGVTVFAKRCHKVPCVDTSLVTRTILVDEMIPDEIPEILPALCNWVHIQNLKSILVCCDDPCCPYFVDPASSGAHSELYRCMIRYVVNDCSEGRVCFDGHLDACLCFACFLCRCYLGTWLGILVIFIDHFEMLGQHQIIDTAHPIVAIRKLENIRRRRA